MLTLARAHSGQELPRVEAVELGPLLREVAAGLHPHAGVTVDVEVADGLAVEANRDLLEQALRNLGENAAKHTGRGSVTLRAYGDGSTVTVEVEDSGPGMSPEVQRHVFDRFYRGERDAHGFGLGLAIVRESVRTLGARIELQRLRHEPGRDALTGLADARGFHARLRSEVDRARRHGLALGVVAVDLDRFAALNARHGRERGDQVLQEVALVLKLTLRESDALARLGGNRFGVILPEADLVPSRRCAERLRSALEAHRFTVAGRVTASFGVAACPRSGVDSLELLDSADKALDIAKKSGRRRVAVLEAPHVH